MKNILTFIILGIFYLGIEIIVRINAPELNQIWSIYSLVGWTSFWMFFIGGICGYLIGRINENRSFWRLPILVQSIIGTLLTLSIELITGIFFNIILKLNLWDYSNLHVHFLGQICLKNGILFFIAMPAIIWLDDLLRHGLYKDGSVYPFFENYKRLCTLK